MPASKGPAPLPAVGSRWRLTRYFRPEAVVVEVIDAWVDHRGAWVNWKLIPCPHCKYLPHMQLPAHGPVHVDWLHGEERVDAAAFSVNTTPQP